MEIVIAIIGLLLAIVALPWLKRPLENALHRFRTLAITMRARLFGVPNGLAKVQLIRSRSPYGYMADFMICEWTHKVMIYNNGDTQTSIDCTFVNTTDQPKIDIRFPLYFDFDYETVLDPITFWVKIGRKEFKVFPENWDENTHLGIVRIPFPAPLDPRRHIRIRWGYPCLAIYDRPGHHWFEWHFACPHSIFRLTLEFDDQWLVSSVIASIPNSDQKPPEPNVRAKDIYWCIKAPIPGYKYRLDWILDRSQAAPNNSLNRSAS